MNFCYRCGTQIGESANFCAKCGTVVISGILMHEQKNAPDQASTNPNTRTNNPMSPKTTTKTKAYIGFFSSLLIAAMMLSWLNTPQYWLRGGFMPSPDTSENYVYWSSDAALTRTSAHLSYIILRLNRDSSSDSLGSLVVITQSVMVGTALSTLGFALFFYLTLTRHIKACFAGQAASLLAALSAIVFVGSLYIYDDAMHNVLDVKPTAWVYITFILGAVIFCVITKNKKTFSS